MSERKSQTRYIPLRVRFRPANEYQRYGREQSSTMTEGGRDTQPLLPDLTHASEAERHARQIKELIRLSNLLRADLGLDEVLQQMATSMASCTGFRRLAIKLIDDDEERLLPVAFAGLTEAEQRRLREGTFPVEKMLSLMRPEFRISQSFFIPHEHRDLLQGMTVLPSESSDEDDYQPGQWHPDDYLFIPLYSPREQKLFGCLSLNAPQDGKIPTVESIEVIELFAHQAAIAIDNARLFQEREDERVALEEAIAFLREDLEVLQRGDLRLRVRSTHRKLQPVADAVNAMVEEISAILGSMQQVTQAVDEHIRSVQHNSELLVSDTVQQEQQVHRISQVVGDIAGMIHTISERAAILSKTAVEAVDVTNEAQGTVDRAVEGMSMVREATMQSARTMKTLSESGQEINETVLAISDLTMRMHLLALNAAIEATRAGEQGRSFAVVAQEIRSLAVHSSDAARKVAAYIRTIQHETTAVSQSVEQSTQHVVMQTELMTQTGVALEAIGIVTDQLSHLVRGICSIAESQSQGSPLVVNAINEIFRMTGDINGHMREMQQSMAHVVESTEALRSRIAIIRLRER